LDTHDPSLPVVIIIQLCKLKKYLGEDVHILLYLLFEILAWIWINLLLLIYLGVMGISNAFYGTKLMLNADIPEVTDYIQR
jgi:hypothetical protein